MRHVQDHSEVCVNSFHHRQFSSYLASQKPTDTEVKEFERLLHRIHTLGLEDEGEGNEMEGDGNEMEGEGNDMEGQECHSTGTVEEHVFQTAKDSRQQQMETEQEGGEEPEEVEAHGDYEVDGIPVSRIHELVEKAEADSLNISDLTTSERDQFIRAVKKGVLTKYMTGVQDSGTDAKVNTNNDPGNAVHERPVSATCELDNRKWLWWNERVFEAGSVKPPSHVCCSSKEANPAVIFAVLEVLYAFALLERRYCGNWETEPECYMQEFCSLAQVLWNPNPPHPEATVPRTVQTLTERACAKAVSKDQEFNRRCWLDVQLLIGWRELACRAMKICHRRLYRYSQQALENNSQRGSDALQHMMLLSRKKLQFLCSYMWYHICDKLQTNAVILQIDQGLSTQDLE
eukprot:GHVQ01016294.1.p1 GENE.GHVQ01016294.1~~GHVQ01016294.1.p1  ORF type:complete len:402 (+),score=50.26 GHVQ01016294.1:1017-2222(+)